MKGPGIELRTYGEIDRNPFQALVCDPEIMKHAGGALSPESAQSLFDRIKSGTDQRIPLARAIQFQSTQQWVGHVAFSKPSKGSDPELIFLIHPDHQGKGFATKAASLAIQEGFQSLAWDKIIATVDERHKPSIRVLEKIGMIFERTDTDRQGTFRIYSRTRASSA